MTSSEKPVTFDPQRRAALPGLKAQIETFTRHLESEEHRLGIRSRARRENDRRSFQVSVEAIACNLLITAMVAPDATLCVPRGHAAMWSGGRYRNPVYGQHFLDILYLMETLKLTAQVTKGYRYSQRERRPTTTRAMPALSDHLPLGRTELSDFRQDEEPELIILKPKKDDDGRAPPIGYTDTARTKKWRREVQAINAWLATAPITLADNPSRLARLDRDGQPIEPYRRTLHRVFNNADWNAGGRLFGGFWMTMERSERFRTIRIAGEEIANVDFSSLFPRLAYVRAGAEQPEDDLYNVTGDGTCRDGWKALINALLFARRPLGGWPTDARDELPLGMKLRDAIAAIKRKHAPIVSLFEQGLGYELMRHEADLLIFVVTALFKQGITALPLHDSVLIARSHAETARAFMEQEFKHRTVSSRAFVEIDFGLI